jgi:hypothetical protein
MNMLIKCFEWQVNKYFPVQHIFICKRNREFHLVLVWIVAPCSLEGAYQRLGETYCLLM